MCTATFFWVLGVCTHARRRRRMQLDGVIHEVADQLEAFRQLQRLLGLLTSAPVFC